MSKENTKPNLWRKGFLPSIKFDKPGATFEGTILGGYVKQIKDDFVPHLHVVDSNGEEFEIGMGSHILAKLYYSGELKEGYQIGLKYVRDDEKIGNANNKMKHFDYYLLDQKGNQINPKLDKAYSSIDPYSNEVELSERNIEKMQEAFLQSDEV